ncbi:hypothetical protein SBV1_260018 [Verrucomicrobia bacterium]|nr:hypothetical protein SBV1_260018 [Verrucomicrobiota bacterium]
MAGTPLNQISSFAGLISGSFPQIPQTRQLTYVDQPLSCAHVPIHEPRTRPGGIFNSISSQNIVDRNDYEQEHYSNFHPGSPWRFPRPQ